MAGMRRSEVAALRWADLAEAPGGDGILVAVGRGKTNQAGEAAEGRVGLASELTTMAKQVRTRSMVVRATISPATGAPMRASPSTWPWARGRPRWEVHERCEGRGAGWRHHAAFERRRDALVFLDTTAAASGGESVTTAPARRRETPEPSQEPPQSSPRRTPKGPITHDLDETRSQDIPWSLCGVLLYDPLPPALTGSARRRRGFAAALDWEHGGHRLRELAERLGRDRGCRRPPGPAAALRAQGATWRGKPRALRRSTSSPSARAAARSARRRVPRGGC